MIIKRGGGKVCSYSKAQLQVHANNFPQQSYVLVSYTLLTSWCLVQPI